MAVRIEAATAMIAFLGPRRAVEVDRAILGQHGLGIAAVAMIVAAAAGGSPFS